MTWHSIKNLTRRTASDEKLGDKAFNTVKNPRHDEYRRGVALMVFKFFDK